ncbi:MAG: exosortase F system-associated protein [Pedobacter sp.]|nr:MAG: exosortase F system-associated protein [Pedobacter sp.]
MRLNKTSIAAIVILVILLVSVRIFQEALFYDPLLEFFKNESKVLPEYDSAKLFFGVVFRYFLNTALSLGIIYFFFKDLSIIRLASVLYAVFFVVLIVAFFLVLSASEVSLLALFYVRRFLIQPLFLLLFVPAFYYQRSIR